MKKFFLLLSLMLASTAMMAQRVLPTFPVAIPKGQELVISNPDDDALDAEPMYLFNVEVGGFVVGANDWGTRASISRTSGITFGVTATDTEGLYRLTNNEGARAFDCDGGLQSWVDGQGRSGDGTWVINNLDNNMFTLSNNLAKNASGTLLLWGAEHGQKNTRIIFNDKDSFYGNTWIAVSEEDFTTFVEQASEKAEEIAAYDSEALEYYTALSLKTWIDKVSAETGVATDAQKAIYDNEASTLEELTAAKDSLKKVSDAHAALKAAIQDAEANYKGIDLSAQKAVLNANSTVEEFNAAKDSLKEAITAYLSNKEASLENPLDITETIASMLPGSDTELNNNWTREWTGTGTVGTFHMNTWSTEGNSDGTEMRTPFIEDWVGKGSILSNQKYYHNPIKVKPGVYKIMANIRTYNESQGATENRGAYLYANNNRNDLLEQKEGAKQDYYNGMLYYWNPDFETYAIVTEDSTLTFGVLIENANFNWVAAKNFRVIYLGTEIEAYNVVRENTELMAPKYDPEEVYAEKALLNEYLKAYETYEESTTIADINAAYNKVGELADALIKSVASYTAYAALVNGYCEGINSGEYNYNGDMWAEFCDYVLAEMEGTIEPGKLDAEEIDAKAEALKKQFEEAVKGSIGVGDDCTRMLTNPSFSDGFNGWTNETGGKPNGNENCGLDICKNVEVYENTVDVQQTIEGVPDGIYAISCQAFERPAGNGGYDGSEVSKVYLFMNDFKTPVQNICKDAMPEDLAENQVNCYSGEENGAWPYDYNVDGYGWVPNSVDGASYAFAAGRYVQTTYGLVEDGKMTIGLTSNGVKAHWVLWANFKLTYEGKTAEAATKVLESRLPVIEEYYIEQKAEGTLTAPAAQVLGDAIDAAKKSMDGNDGEAMIQALIALNKAYDSAVENVAAVEKIQDVYDALNSEALDQIDEMEDEQYTDKYEQYDEIISNEEYLEYTTEELITFVNEVNAFIKEVALAYGMWEAEQVFEEIADLISDASDEEPVDLTDYIINPALDNGNAEGWTLNLIHANNCQYQSASYTRETEDGDYTNIAGFLESWRPSGSECVQADIYQNLMLPAGTYKLGADMIASNQADAAATVTGVYLYAGNNDLAISTGNGKPEHFDLIFKLTEEKNYIKIGFRSEEGGNANWIAADNFTLEAYGANSEISPTAIETIAVEAQKSIYSLTGVRLNKVCKPGLYIINGKAVLVK